MSYILTLKDLPEGVFSVVDKSTGEHVIPIFDEQDDCERYAEHTSPTVSRAYCVFSALVSMLSI